MIWHCFRRQVDEDIEKLSHLVGHIYRTTGDLPIEQDFSLTPYWQQYRPGFPEPIDPFDGNAYGYQRMGNNRFLIWSVGPDGKNNTEDDILVDMTQ